VAQPASTVARASGASQRCESEGMGNVDIALHSRR
jgi:hypothetical protein